MEIIIGAIISWITSNILDKIFRKNRTKEVLEQNNKRLIELLEARDELISTLEKERKKGELERSTIFDSIRKSGLSTEKLIEKYNKPINAILICTYFQKVPDETPYGKDYKFIFEELQRYNGKSLGGGIYVIPPQNMPEKINNRNDLNEWFDNEILKGRYCKLKFLILFDLRKNAYWMNNLPYQPTDNPFHRTHRNIGEVLPLEDIFNEDQIAQTTTIAKIVSHGDIGWLAHKYISEVDLAKLRVKQLSIENSLGNPTLKELVHGDYQSKIENALETINIDNPSEVAKSIIREAKYWYKRIK